MSVAKARFLQGIKVQSNEQDSGEAEPSVNLSVDIYSTIDGQNREYDTLGSATIYTYI